MSNRTISSWRQGWQGLTHPAGNSPDILEPHYSLPIMHDILERWCVFLWLKLHATECLSRTRKVLGWNPSKTKQKPPSPFKKNQNSLCYLMQTPWRIREVPKFTLSIRLRCRISNCSLAFWKRACSLSSAEVSKYTSTSLVGRGVGGTETKLQKEFALRVKGQVRCSVLKLHSALGRKPSSGPARWTQFVSCLTISAGCYCLPSLHFVRLEWAIFFTQYLSTMSVHANTPIYW